jgi:hypothetical protein
MASPGEPVASEGVAAERTRRLLKRVVRGLVRRVTSAGRRRAPHGRGARLVFVGGAPRSGTTLVQHILDSHPDVFGGPEFDCVPTLMESRRRVLEALNAGRITVFCTRAQVDAAFTALVEDLLLPVADAHHCRLLSEKTPYNVGVFDDLLDLLPGCRAVHVVRDPRAVVASMLQVGARARRNGTPCPPWTADVAEAIRFVRSQVDCGFRASHNFQARVLTLTYEALVSDPEPHVRRLCDFLGLGFQPAMLRPEEREHPGQSEIDRLDRGTWLDPRLGYRAIEASRLGAWRNQLDAAQAAAVSAAFRDHEVLRVLGYTFD